MKKLGIRKYWTGFLHWKGWGAFACRCATAWKAVVSWRGWKAVFGLPFSLVLLLSLACAFGLVWVFTHGMETQLPAYCLYPLSFYCLVALCAKLPGAIGKGRSWLSGHPQMAAFFHSSEKKFTRKLYREQVINFAYGSFKIGAGVVYGSAWIGSDGIYNLTQSLIQLFQILRRKKAGTLEQQWRSYRLCGVLVLLMHLTLTGIVFQMVNWNRAQEQGEILVITTAAFAFYKITTSFIRIAKDRKHLHPVDSSVRMLNLAQAIFAMFSLQASMFHTFGTGESWERLMNTITGCGVCLLIVSIGIYMILRGNREIKTLQETQYGA